MNSKPNRRLGRAKARAQRAQYPSKKEYGLNYIGLHIMFKLHSLIKGYWALWGFRVWGLGLKTFSFAFSVWGLGLRTLGFGFRGLGV